MQQLEYDYDYIVIGSGFGGSVSALRLAEKGYKVLVIEKGKWFRAADFPTSNWHLRKWLWLPKLGCFGILKLTFFRHVSILSGTGVGGGSLVYANTLPIPKPEFFQNGSWRELADWQSELAPFYKIAARMLGAAPNPTLFEGDLALQALAKEIGMEAHFAPTEVAVYFGKPGETVPDPYFDGKGPTRTGCIYCGGCMTGCRHNAKNTLDKNYLYLAQQLGVEILAENEVFEVAPLDHADGTQGYEVRFQKTTSWSKKRGRFTTKGVIFAGGVMGTVKLLLKLKKSTLPRLSDRLGYDIRTNNESLIPITSLDSNKDLSQGVAIGSILHTDADSHLEPVRYAKGSGFWRLLMLPAVQGNTLFARIFNIFKDFFLHPLENMKLLLVRDWAKSTSILLFMQHLDSTLRLSRNRLGWVNTSVDQGKSPSAFIPRANDLAARYSKLIKGKTTIFVLESLLGIPSTAHILGGCGMGEGPEQGVIDKYNRVFGYQNMLICDGSAISANPGVNPSLSITAISEHAMSKIPIKEIVKE